MSANTTVFEVEVKVLQGRSDFKPIKYSSKVKGLYCKSELVRGQIIKMFHIESRTPEQAMQKGRKYGEPVSCRKMDVLSSLSSIEKLSLEQPTIYGKGNPYKSAVAMGEMVWNKQRKNRDYFLKNRDNSLDK